MGKKKTPKLPQPRLPVPPPGKEHGDQRKEKSRAECRKKVPLTETAKDE
jgi:hypothetical protein